MKRLLDHLKSSKLHLEETDVHFNVNDENVTIKNGQIPPTLSLASFLRSHMGLTGTKVMCNQAGCGACIVTAYVPDESDERGYKVISVNSCVTPVLSCDGWHIVTVEGLGNRKEGMHPIQQRLAAFHGTQCGYCSPGMVMQMNSLMEKKPKGSSMKDIEHILDGNICRCTGYRPIHDAFKSFATDASDNIKKKLADIEDVLEAPCQAKSVCPSTGKPCGGNKSCSIKGDKIKHQSNWYMPASMDELMAILQKLPDETKYRLVGGNTATGIYDDGPYDVFIDVKKVGELKKTCKAPLEVGGGVSLNDWMDLMQSVANEPEYHYATAIVDHLKVVASTGVRNTGTLAGNLMIKHAHQYFPSDCFLLLEALGANIVVSSDGGKTDNKYSPEEWLKISMEKKVVKKVCLPALSKSHVFRSYKITPRQVHAHAYVNAAFLLNVGSKDEGFKVKEKPSICFGGITEDFVHASKTEAFLNGKCLNDPNTLKEALQTLKDELKPHAAALEAEPAYRKNLAQGLLYKTFLSILSETLDSRLKSGGDKIQRFKEVSSGQHFYPTDENLWPLNKGVHKVEGQSQCTGELEYVDDIPKIHGELYAAVVQAKQANCELDTVDAGPALALPGVKYFIDHTCVPGANSWVPWDIAEEIFSSGKIHYAGQAIGLILADDQDLARQAVDLVKVTYKNLKPLVVDLKEAMKDAERIKDSFPAFFGFNPQPARIGDLSAAKARSDLTQIEGELELGSQYHFYMETLSAVCRPKEDKQIQLWATTQWMDFTQNLVAAALNIPKNHIDMEVKRIGGGYGGKCTPAFFVAAATAVAAWKVNKPVRFVMDLKSNMNFIGKREPYLFKYKAGVDADNTLQYVEADIFANCGWTQAECLTLMETIPFSQNAYNSKVWSLTPYAVITDLPRATATRAPGTSQGHSFIENLMDHMAAKLQADPLEFRKKNFLQEGDMKLGGHPFKGKNPLPDMMQQLSQSSAFEERKAQVEAFNAANKWKKRGISMVPVNYEIHSIMPIPYYAHVTVFEGDGSVSVTSGGIEMGQGLNTKVAQTVAKELGVPLEMVKIKPADVMTSPNNAVTGGSTTSEVTCHAAKKACEILKERMAPIAKAMEGAKWHELVQACFFQGVDLCARHMGHAGNDKLNGYHIWAVIVSEVEIDLLTGERNVLRCDLMEDTGATLNPEIDIGQIEGGFVFGLGWWLQEHIKYDEKTGQLLTKDTWDYKVPSCYDIPQDMRTTLCSTNRMEGTLGSKATGEPSMLMGCSVAFAIRNALKAARLDLEIQGDDNIPGWINIDGPLTVEKQLLLSGVEPKHFTI